MTVDQDDGTAQLDILEGFSGRVAQVTIDHPARRNAISPGVIAGLKHAFDTLAEDHDLRAVILTGTGDQTFSAGADVRVLARLTSTSARAFITSLHEAVRAVRLLPVPVVARLRGHCLGAAVELAAACDVRVGDTSIIIGMPEVQVGIPSVIEAALLPGLVGQGRAREMLLTGRAYDAAAAREMGYLQSLTEPDGLDEAVVGVVADIVAAGPHAVRTQKALLNHWQAPGLDEAIAVSIDAFAAAYETDEPARYLAPYVKP